MNLLHISSDYPYTSLYRDLLHALASDPDLRQTMYVPLPHSAATPPPEPPSDTIQVMYSLDYRAIHRPLYHRKRRRIHESLTSQLDASSFDLVHAHFLFSAGGVAYELLQRSALPFVVSVRSTDVNFFFPRMPHLRAFGLEIMRAAEQVIFVSPAHQRTLFERYVPASLQDEFEAKTVHVPNGIDPWWLADQPPPRRLDDGKVRLLFVGELTRNKNVEMVVAATARLRELGVDASLHIVGSGPLERKVDRLVAKHTFVERTPRIAYRDGLREVYRSADVFVMPSIRETFGIVYLEAMSQGLPIVYTKGQGIDGYFPGRSVGSAVDPSNIDDIATNLRQILDGYRAISEASAAEATMYSWARVSRDLSGTYARATK